MPLLTPSNKRSLTLPAAAAVDAPELAANAQSVGAGPRTIVNDKRVVQYAFDTHEKLVADLNATLGGQDFTTIFELQPLPSYFAEIGVQKGGNMLGLDRSPKNRLYFAMGVMLLTETAIKQLPQVYQMSMAAATNVTTYAKSVGLDDDFIYLPYADASQDALGSYGPANVAHMKQVAKAYDPTGFFQDMVPGGFKISRVTG